MGVSPHSLLVRICTLHQNPFRDLLQLNPPKPVTPLFPRYCTSLPPPYCTKEEREDHFLTGSDLLGPDRLERSPPEAVLMGEGSCIFAAQGAGR